MNKVWMIADTHFGHSKIINFESRPFHTIEEMDETLIDNWNKVVKNGHDVFINGDFSFYGKDKTKEIVSKLNGIKHLITGNHDGKSRKFYLECGIEQVIQFPILYENFFVLSHQPIYLNENMPYANIFGHVHSNPMYEDFTSQSFCVSAERINYTPIDFEQIKKSMRGYKK